MIDMDEFQYSGKMKPKEGLPKLLAQMWDLQKLLWFDERFLKDPLGFDTELTSETFIGLFCITIFIKPIVTVILAPLLYTWFDWALITQVFSFLIYGLTPVEIVEEYDYGGEEVLPDQEYEGD